MKSNPTPTPSFFVPLVPPEDQEHTFVEFAKSCNRPVPHPTQRVYAITFRHDSESWVATVGKQLNGTRTTSHRAKGQKIERQHAVYDSALVLAILPGIPYLVVTDRTLGVSGSQWESPFMAGRPDSVTYFRGGDALYLPKEGP